MIIKTYEPDKKFQRGRCQICGHNRWLAQHHIMGRKNSELSILICSNGGPVVYNNSCHDQIHNPTAFGLPASWAYDNGYLIRADAKFNKKIGKTSKHEIHQKKSPASKWRLKKGTGINQFS